MTELRNLPLSNIIRVHAAKRGTAYVLVVSMIKGEEVIILETRSGTKIRKELGLVREFLEMEGDEVNTIFDESGG